MEKGNLKFRRVPKDLTEFMIFFFFFFFSKLAKKLRNFSSGLVKLSRFGAIWKFKFHFFFNQGEVAERLYYGVINPRKRKHFYYL